MGDGDDHSNELRRMKFTSVDALSELVWSPRNGLSLRCADFSFTPKGKLLSSSFFDDTNHMESHSKSTRGAVLANEQLTLERSQEEPNNRGVGAAHTSKALVVCESKGECLLEEETDPEKAGPKAKGKEKALSDEESFGSVESCNSAGLLSRGKKRPGFEQQLILGSKRLKTLSQECLESTSKLKQDSSFINWISNMTKGIWKGNEEDNSPFVALTTTSEVNAQQEMSPCCLNERNTGFQLFFQSIYCQKKRDQDAVKMDSSNAASLQVLPWIPEQCLNTKGNHVSSSGNEVAPVAEPNISSGKVGINQTNETFSSEKKQEDKESNNSLLSLSKSKPSEEQKICGEADEKVVQCLTNKNSGLESLWISRFSSKSCFLQKKDLLERVTNDSSSDAVSQNAILPIVSSMRIESSEAMATLLARRLEAMKHMLPTGSLAENTEDGQKNLICFYCGKKGHRLEDCLEVTDNELRDLFQNINAQKGREEGSSLCIRCFQLSHWAATCLYSLKAEDRAIASTSGTKLSYSAYVPKAVFDTVQVLRLTRTDVLKWIKSKKSVSGLEGFFLRLRLGKWAEGLGGTGYHVARIEGATEGQSSVSVKVGGMICFVESQFISNHDFLEEELLAWWRSAGRSGIPSAEELSRKVEQRKMLGFLLKHL